jgi:hypothetical protein
MKEQSALILSVAVLTMVVTDEVLIVNGQQPQLQYIWAPMALWILLVFTIRSLNASNPTPVPPIAVSQPPAPITAPKPPTVTAPQRKPLHPTKRNAPAGARKARKKMDYAHLSTAAVVRAAAIMLISAFMCAVVGYYIYLLVWVGQHIPDLGLSTWASFQWKDKLNVLHTIHPAAFALILLVIWGHFERGAANANPGYGWLWMLDFWPTALLLAFLALTALKLALAGITFDNPTNLIIFGAFLLSAASVAYYNARHWFKARFGYDVERVATIDQIVEAVQRVMGSHSVTLHSRAGYNIVPERAFVATGASPPAP